jgi:hypothetical protein
VKVHRLDTGAGRILLPDKHTLFDLQDLQFGSVPLDRIVIFDPGIGVTQKF